MELRKVIHIDIPKKRTQVNPAKPANYDAESVKATIGLQDDLKPINISQPDGVSFDLQGRNIKWQKWSMHIGFNYREGIVLSNVTFNDTVGSNGVRPV